MYFVTQIQIVAWITAAISIASLVVNIVSLISGITPVMKKIILIEWVLGLILTVICVLVALLVFLNNYFLPKYAN
jgi:hypothetical protein